MPKYAIIDTESNGLFKYKDEAGNTLPSDGPGQPRMASFYMILLNDDLSIQEEYGALIKPDGWSMTPETTAINGLTDERLLAEGKPIKEVMEVYAQAVREGFVIVAYNSQHDLRHCRAELRRAGMPDLFEQTPNVCVMRASKGVIPRPDGKSAWPKLEHCRQYLNLSDDGAHGAKADAHAALAVLLHLIGQGVKLEPEVHFAKGGKPPAAEPLSPELLAHAQQAAEISRPRAPVPPGDVALQEIPE